MFNGGLNSASKSKQALRIMYTMMKCSWKSLERETHVLSGKVILGYL